MKKLSAILSVLLVAVLLLGLAACGTSGKTETTPPATKSPATETQAPVENLPPIKIGSIQDTTGGASLAGKPQAWGVEYAVQYINDNGGINGRMIEVYTRDCQNDAEVGVTCYRELVDEIGVCAIIGPALSNPASAWVELATEDKVPIVGHFMDELCTTDPDTGKTYPYMFLAEPSCAGQSYIIADYGMKELGVKTVATLYNTSNAFAVAHEGPFVDFIEANGGTVLARETFTWADTDYSAQAQKIAAANPDAVFLCDYAVQVVPAYDNLRDAGYKGIILAANTLAPPFNTLVKNDIYDCYFVQNYDLSDPNTGNVNQLIELHMTTTGTDYLAANVAFGWDAVMVLYNAMVQANDPTDGAEVRDILENNTKDVLLSSGMLITIDPATHRPTSDMGMFIATYDANKELDFLTYQTTTFKK